MCSLLAKERRGEMSVEGHIVEEEGQEEEAEGFGREGEGNRGKEKWEWRRVGKGGGRM